MVESTALEMRRRGDSTVGSNPTLSAIPYEKELPSRELFLWKIIHLFMFAVSACDRNPILADLRRLYGDSVALTLSMPVNRYGETGIYHLFHAIHCSAAWFS